MQNLKNLTQDQIERATSNNIQTNGLQYEPSEPREREVQKKPRPRYWADYNQTLKFGTLTSKRYF